MRFEDKTAFVAGGAGGIGLGIPQAFAEAGAEVAVLAARKTNPKPPWQAWESEATRFSALIRL